MAHFMPSPLLLDGKYNKTIKPGKTNKESSIPDVRDSTAWVAKDGMILERPIHIYRMWYRFLQLALELEDKNVQVITRNHRVLLDNPEVDKYGHEREYKIEPVVYSVAIDRTKYAGWDLDVIPDTPFDEWWGSHRSLFFDEPATIMTSPDDWSNDPRYVHVRVDIRKRPSDLLKEIRRLLRDVRQERTGHYETNFPIHGKVRVNTLINRYNALILRLTSKKTDIEILRDEAFRPTSAGMETPRDGNNSHYNPGLFQKEDSSTMRDLLKPAKIALLSVCDGHFVFNPAKNYLK